MDFRRTGFKALLLPPHEGDTDGFARLSKVGLAYSKAHPQRPVGPITTSTVFATGDADGGLADSAVCAKVP